MRTPFPAHPAMTCLFLLFLSGNIFGQKPDHPLEIMAYDPVCAANGKSYVNPETARADGAVHLEKGHCSSYRAVKCQDPNRLWISEVEVNGMSEKSGAEGYLKAVNVIFDLNKYESNIISLSRKPDTAIGVRQWKVWIDFDGDLVFEPDEMVVDAVAQDIAVPISIPENVAPGTLTRMRVFVGQRGTGPISDTIPFGEVEDYTVQILF